MRTHLHLALLCTGLLSVACNKSDDSNSASSSTPPLGERPTAASGTMPKEQAAEFIASSSGELATTAMSSVNGSGIATITSTLGSMPSTPTALKAMKQAGIQLKAEDPHACEPTVISGSTTDTDSDYIFDEYSAKLECNVAAEYATLTASGTISIQDKEPTVPFTGFAAAIDDYRYNIELKGDGATSTISSSMSAAFESSVDGLVHTAKADLDTIFEAKTAEQNATVAYGTFFDSKWTAEDDGNDTPFDKGTMNTITGFIKVNVVSPDATQQFALAVEGTDLVRSSCTDEGFDSGTMTLTDGAGNKMVGTFSACSSTWTYNGEAL